MLQNFARITHARIYSQLWERQGFLKKHIAQIQKITLKN